MIFFKLNGAYYRLKFRDKHILVTGGAGFIGSHLTKRLLKLGCEVSIADNLSRGRKENLTPILHKIHFHKVDLTVLEDCLKVTENIDYVFHLAASVGGIHYIKKENVGGSTPSILMNTNMLEAARINDIDRFLFTSSACVYRGKFQELNQFKEEDAYPANPLTTYGWAKLLAEIQCKAYHLDYNLKSSVVRIFNAYGEHENLDPRWSHVIPSLIRKAIVYPAEGFKIFGDGNQERAFLYVKDCVEGLLRCIKQITNAEPINLGSKEVVSIRELANQIIALSGKDIRLETDPPGPQGTYKYCADTTRMEKILGWVPQTSLAEGLRNTYNWVRQELNVG